MREVSPLIFGSELTHPVEPVSCVKTFRDLLKRRGGSIRAVTGEVAGENQGAQVPAVADHREKAPAL